MGERQDSMKKSISISFHVSESYRRILLYNPKGSIGSFKPTDYSDSPCVALVGQEMQERTEDQLKHQMNFLCHVVLLQSWVAWWALEVHSLLGSDTP